MKQLIIDKSKELNIDLIGFTDCSPLINLEDYLINRRENQIEVEFEEKDMERRIYPKTTFPNCKSIIVIAMSYNNDFNQIPDYKLKGRISKSSWGMDYHRVLKDKIEKLIEEIQKEEGFSYV